MARNRRMRRTSRPRQSRDWVYRGNVYASDGSIADPRASYIPTETNILVGSGNAAGKILYDSQNYLQESVNVFPIGAPLSRAARAEGRRPFIHMVDGTVRLRPSTWAAGSQLNVAGAIIIAPQDPLNGAPLMDVEFSLWDVTLGDPALGPWTWVNMQKVMHVRRAMATFSDNNQYRFLTWRFSRIRKSLDAHECIFLYVEASEQAGSASVNTLIAPFMRTLVSDEG